MAADGLEFVGLTIEERCMLQHLRLWLPGIMVVLLAGCAETSVIPISSAVSIEPTRAVGTEPKDVEIFYDVDEIKRPYVVFAHINHLDPGKFNRINLGDVLPILRKKGRELHADGVIIDNTKEWRTGLLSTGIILRTRAIRYTGKLPVKK